jgi:hypothetical protein
MLNMQEKIRICIGIVLAGTAAVSSAAALFFIQFQQTGAAGIAVVIMIFSFTLETLFLKYICKISRKKIAEFRLRLRILRHLYEAGIYTITRCNTIRYPRIEVCLNDDRTKGTVEIEQSIKTQQKLDHELSAAFDDYIVQRSYISRNRNSVIFEIVSFDYNPQLVFTSFKEMSEYCRKHADGWQLIIDRDLTISYQHVLITGQTGSGKSYAMYALIFQMLEAGTDLFFCDLKNAGIAILGSTINPAHTATTLQNVMELLRELKDLQDGREAIVKEALQKQKRFDGDWRMTDLKPCCLIIDEYAALQAVIKDSDRKTQSEFNAILTALLLKGRSTGIYLMISMQQANASIFPTKFRDNLSAKFLLRRGLERETAVTTFGEAEASELPTTDADVGEAYYKVAGINTDVSTCTFPRLDFDLRELL